MKRVVSLICVAAIFAAMLSFASCGKKSAQDISGSYRLVELISNGKDISESIATVGVTLTVEGDQATFAYMEETFIWKVDTKAQTMSIDDVTKIPYTLKGDRLTVEEKGGSNKMVFEKQ